MASSSPSTDDLIVLITGANAGLGYSISHRLASEFLYTRPKSARLTLILTTRSAAKATSTLQRLRSDLHRTLSKSFDLERIAIDTETLELTDLRSVVEASRRLRLRYARIDVVICNAGIGGWTTVDIWKLAKQFVREPIGALTWPNFKVSSAGGLTGAQVSRQTLARYEEGYAHRDESQDQGEDYAAANAEGRLGQVFCANVFGHYMLVHELTAQLQRGRPLETTAENNEGGRVIWISSLEAYADSFTTSDPQCLRTPLAYEGSKRLTDILAITSRLPSVKPWVYGPPRGHDSCVFFIDDPYEHARDDPGMSVTENGEIASSYRGGDRGKWRKPKMYLAHPGICATNIMPLPRWTEPWVHWILLAAFYICRLCGSIWHTAYPWSGATAPVWLALASVETLDSMERKGMTKWGSAADMTGERVERTEVEAWGVPGGALEEGNRRGRTPNMRDTSEEDRVRFEEEGRECWMAMERLRCKWDTLLAMDADPGWPYREERDPRWLSELGETS